MLLHETPQGSGWYWVQSAEFGDCMAYLHAEREPRQIDLFFSDADIDYPLTSYLETGEDTWVRKADLERDEEESWSLAWPGPSCWVGPLTTPFGPFQENTAELSEDVHRRAEENGQAALLLHINYQNCEPPFGSINCVKLMSMEEANMAMVKVFGQLGTGT